MRRDAYRLRREVDETKRQAGVLASTELRQLREKARADLDLSLPEDLPISAHGSELLALLESSAVVVVAGETGSGKTTQLPKLALQLGLGVGAMIAHTQPRRLAARTVAKRIADEMGCELGGAVGHAVRFSDQVSDASLLKVMTDGLLLAEIRTDRFLNAYDLIIIDEAHERSLNIDFLLGYLKQLLRRRNDLKVIITSATIDVQRFSSFFDDAPIVAVSGRTYPVRVCYLDTQDNDEPFEGIVQALNEIDASPMKGARDVLVFFSGEREIFEAAKTLRRQFGERFEILPLYARLSFAEQRKIFAPATALRRIVLATNVAETSLTVPNIGYVIDPGFARVSRYSYRSKLQRLPIEPVSQASANQRKGRCGRIAPGVCYRLYSEQDFLGRPEFTDAEIHRVNLASVLLQMQAFKLGDIRRFPFLDPPDPRAIKDAVRLLEELQALSQGQLTDVGYQMARMPIDPRLARMIAESHKLGSLSEVIVIVSALAIQDPRERPLQKMQAADAAHEKFADEKSDFLSYLNLWNFLQTQRQALTRGRFSSLLKKRFLSHTRVSEWREVHRQLHLICKTLNFRFNTTPGSYRAVHESILAGSLSLIGLHDERGQYLGARQLKLRIFPGSGLAGKTPKWIVAGEVAETSRVYARNVAAVEPGWIEQQAQHLLKHQSSEPFWSISRGEVMAFDTISLYGLRLADRRQFSLSSIDPVFCRDLFLREAMVAGQVKQAPEFLAHNLAEIAQIENLEAKGRRRDLLLNDDEIYAFYAQRLPEHIVRLADLNHWLRGAHAEQVNALFLTREALLTTEAGALPEQAYPAELELNGLQLPLRYRFAPGEIDDGVTVVIPVGLLNGISAEALEWTVPGLLPALIEQWLRTLPKQKRRTLVPLPEKVDELSAVLLMPKNYRLGRLLAALATLLHDRYRLQITESDWDRGRIAAHLLMYIEVIDSHSKVVAAGRDLRVIKQSLSKTQQVAMKTSKQIERFGQRGLTEFPQGALEDQLVLGDQSAPVIKYPGLFDHGERVDLVLFDDTLSRDVAHRQGLIRLALLRLGKVGQYFRKALDQHPKLGLHFAALGDAKALKEELLSNIVWYCFFEETPLPKNADQFAAALELKRGQLAGVFSETVGQFAEIMALRFECMRLLDDLQSVAYVESKKDILRQINELAPRNVLTVTPQRFLILIPRFLSGIVRRLQNLPGHVPKDLKQISEMRAITERYQKIKKAELADPGRVLELGFYVQELRLVLFAETVARQKLNPHPLDQAFFGPLWKASTKRVAAHILSEEQRVGLA